MPTINIRVDEKLKKECEDIFSQLGLGLTSAITVFLKACVRKKGMPFTLEVLENEVAKKEPIKKTKISKKRPTKEIKKEFKNEPITIDDVIDSFDI